MVLKIFINTIAKPHVKRLTDGYLLIASYDLLGGSFTILSRMNITLVLSQLTSNFLLRLRSLRM